MLQCTACGTQNPDDFKFCENCGERLALIICPKCSHTNLSDMKFCEECGQRLDVVNCSSCNHENPRDFKFCEECGESLSVQVLQDDRTPKNVEPVATIPSDAAPPKQIAPNPISTSKDAILPKRQLKSRTKPKRASKPASRTTYVPVSPSQTVPPQRASIYAQSTTSRRRPKSVARVASKPSFISRIGTLMAKAVVRFMVSSIMGFVAGKLGMFALNIILPYFTTP